MREGESKSLAALVGPPNSGKTTLYNWLTGSKFKAVNYPGATVSCALGQTHERYGDPVGVMDTPGTYSMFPNSPDEQVTLDALFEGKLTEPVKTVIVVVDATQLRRHLYLARQVKESGFQVVVALTMADLARKSGIFIEETKLSEEIGAPVIPIDGSLGGGVIELVDAVRRVLSHSDKTQPRPLAAWDTQRIEAVLTESEEVARRVSEQIQNPTSAQDDVFAARARWDNLLLHPIWGLALFAAIMTGLFTAIFWLAQPIMDWVDGAFAGLAEAVLSAGAGALWADLVANGILASFGAVLVFVPQIFILFLGISFLEDSGYLARAATLIDRPFSKVGLSGRAFVPLLSGYACAVPALMATRNIRSAKERWITSFIIPLMSCSARLPVYALLLSFLFQDQAAWKPGLALAAIYLGSLGVGAIAAAILNKIVQSSDSSFFMLELPLYRRPRWQVVIRNTVMKTKSYVRRAGPVIFTLAVLIWVGTSFPRGEVGMNETEQVQQSYFGQLGQVIEPVFEPMGLDWRAGIGLISAFAAREVFVSSLAVIFNITENGASEASIQDSLTLKMNEAQTASGEPLFTLASVVGLIVFFMIALQCMSTTAMAQREMGSWKFAIGQLVVLNLVAYGLTVAIVQAIQAFS